MIYFAYAHSVTNYGIIFWGNSWNSIKNLKLQKKMVRIMTNSGSKDSCRDLFKKNGNSSLLFTIHIFHANIYNQ
jgi:hypothetical protein